MLSETPENSKRDLQGAREEEKQRGVFPPNLALRTQNTKKTNYIRFDMPLISQKIFSSAGQNSPFFAIILFSLCILNKNLSYPVLRVFFYFLSSFCGTIVIPLWCVNRTAPPVEVGERRWEKQTQRAAPGRRETG